LHSTFEPAGARSSCPLADPPSLPRSLSRLATIAFYDRVIVMDQGTVAEFDEPLVLFDQATSIFRGMVRRDRYTFVPLRATC
jgi:hypothetical protein